MWLLGLSFLAWILTVLAPCVLPLLPVIIWWSVIEGKKSRPRIIIASFAVSVILFTLLVKVLVDRFGIFPEDLTKVSAYILILFWIVFLFPNLWQKFMLLTWLEHATNKAQQTTGTSWWAWWDILLGFILWPVFNTCSPTYAIIIATVLPASFARGFINILAYTAWLVTVLSLISYWWRKMVNKLKRAANPNWWFRRIVAIIIIVVWVSIVMKRDKAAETWLYENNFVIDTTQREIDQTKKFKE